MATAKRDLLGKLAESGVMSASDAVRLSDYSARRSTGRRAFASAQVSNLTASLSNQTKPIDADIRNGLRRLRARAREEAQNNDHVKGFLRMLKNNVVGHQGMVLQSRAADPNGKPDVLAKRSIEAGWKDWGRMGSADVTGQLSWKMICRQFIETIGRDGEYLARKVRNWNGNRYRFAVQVLDVELLDPELNTDLRSGNVIRMGVELDEWRRPVAYHLLTTKASDDTYSYGGRKYQRIPAEEIYHCFLPEWVWQTRGIPMTATALLRLNMLSGYEESELVASRVAAAKMGFFVDKADEEMPPPGDYPQTTDASGTPIMEADPGSFERLPAGLDFKPWDPQHPNSAYGDFVKACLRGIASGLGVSYNSLANDLEGVNYSSLRHGALQERSIWMELQDWMIEAFVEPVFRDWLHVALLTGELTVAGRPLKPAREEKYQAVSFQPRRWQWVDPAKEMAAHEKAFEHKVRSPQSVIRDMGEDPEAVLDEWAQWEQELETRGLGRPVAAPEPATEEENDAEKDD